MNMAFHHRASPYAIVGLESFDKFSVMPHGSEPIFV
jgi:hypothetical protein